MELIDALETALLSGDGLATYDVIGKTSVTEEFGEDVVPTESIRFRLKCELDAKRVVWAYERTTLDKSSGNPTSVLLDARIVDGSEAVVISGGHAETRRFHSFDEAILKNSIPLQKFWGLLEFPCWGDPVSEIRGVVSRVTEESSTVSVQRIPEGVSFRLREDLGPGQFDLRTWEFSLPSFQPIGHQIQRAAANNQLVKYEDQSLFLKEMWGKKVPIGIEGMHAIIRTTAEGASLGEKKSLTELQWISIGDKGMTASIKGFNFVNAVDIMKFIDVGQQ